MVRYFKYLTLIVLLLSYVISQEQTSVSEDENELSDSNIVQVFQQYIKDFDKKYNSLDEINAKYEIFRDNYKNMKDLTKKYRGRKDKHNVGISKYMDLKPEHFQSEYATAKVSPAELQEAHDNAKNGNDLKAGNSNSMSDPSAIKVGAPTGAIPASWDWRDEGVVSPVKNQKSCGSCYAHSALANIESLYAIKYGAVKQFSEQQIVDCDYKNDGCIGGNMQLAYSYLMKSGGAMSMTSYPYLAKKSATCKFKSATVGVKVKSYFFISSNEEVMKKYLYQNGPLAIIFNASMLQYYKGGIINSSSKTCAQDVLNHAVTIVGYGTSEDGLDYWIVKNSYGPDWGEDGYFRIARGKNTCGINQYVITAVLS